MHAAGLRNQSDHISNYPPRHYHNYEQIQGNENEKNNSHMGRNNFHTDGENSTSNSYNEIKIDTVTVTAVTRTYKDELGFILSQDSHTGKPPGLWSVELAMGYPWATRSPVNFSGAVILHFEDTITSGVVFGVGNRQYKDINSEKKKSNEKFNKNNTWRKFRVMDRRMAFITIFLFIMLSSMLVYTRIFRDTRDGRRTRRSFRKYVNLFCSWCQYFLSCCIPTWRPFQLNGEYSYSQNLRGDGDRDGNRDRNRNRNRDDDEESLDRNVLTLNTQHNSITTLNSITSHVNLSLNDRNIFRFSKSTVSESRSTDSALTVLSNNNNSSNTSINRDCADDCLPDMSYSAGDYNYLDNDESCDSSLAKTISTPSLQSNISTDSFPRKKIISWGPFTHLSPPIFIKSGSESSSLQSKSSSSTSSDGGYGSVCSLGSTDS